MSYENIKLEKGMYCVPNKTFSEVLNELDPSEKYKGSELENLDAFARQLKRFDIKVNGAGSSAVQKFFQTSDSAALFPEYISRAVKQGMEEAASLSDIVATVTKTDSLDYRSICSLAEKGDKELKDVAEGAVIPQTNIKTNDNLVKLNKRGRMLVASYEALKYQRLDLFTVTLRQIGAYIARSQMNDAVNTLIKGDGNKNPAAVINVAQSGNLAYSDLLNLFTAIEPYKLNTIIASPQTVMKLMELDEFKNPLCGINFQATGNAGTPLGAKLVKCSAAGDKIIGLDKSCALEMVVASDVAIDYDKLIDRQLERAAITSTAGFAKIFTDAAKVLKIQ